MTNEEAIAIIRNEYKCVDRDCNIERSCGKCDLMMPSKEPILEAYKLAIKALEQTTWIPCSERLPETDGRYLCTYEDDIEENCVDFGSYKNGEWYVDKVIAWMPLPTSYQGE